MSVVRRPAVAGAFYPAEPRALRAAVRRYLLEARAAGALHPKALIVPHAGYVYSGPVAGSAYRPLEPLRGLVEHVVLVGPSHRVAFRGLALTAAEAFETPLGPVSVDRERLHALAEMPGVTMLEAAHADEHSLEVQLPFLQEILGRFELVPLAAGDAAPEEVARVLEALWNGASTLVVVSSDLSHYYDYETARRLDAATTRAIERLEPEALDEESACGRVPVRGLLLAARRHGLVAHTLDVRSSGDTAGPRDRVVGYGAYAFA